MWIWANYYLSVIKNEFVPMSLICIVQRTETASQQNYLAVWFTQCMNALNSPLECSLRTSAQLKQTGSNIILLSEWCIFLITSRMSSVTLWWHLQEMKEQKPWLMGCFCFLQGFLQAWCRKCGTCASSPTRRAVPCASASTSSPNRRG